MATEHTTHETVTLQVSDGTEMQAYVARPEGTPQRGMLVLQEAFGVNDYMRRVTDQLAAKGYLAITPELFHRSGAGFEGSYTDMSLSMPHMQALTDDGITADMRAAHEWLTKEGVAESKIASIGFCMGGRASFLASATLPVAASVSFYGGGIAQTLLDRVSEVKAPLCLFWGGKDDHILPEHTRAVHDALMKENKSFVETIFSDSRHGFACDARASYHEPSAQLAWTLTHAFLDQKLGA